MRPAGDPLLSVVARAGSRIPVRWPVVVVGGGPAGAATALALARRGVEGVLMLDAGGGGGTALGESIPPAATPLLRGLGVLARVEGGGHLPCPGSQSLWGSDEAGFNDFLFDPVGRGWHLDRARFDAQLRAAAADAGVVVRDGARLTAVEREAGGFRLRVEGRDGAVGGAEAPGPRGAGPGRPASTVRGRVVVDATGVRSAFARRLGVARNPVDALVAVWAVVDAPADAFAGDRTLLEATPHGWWYAARIPGPRLVVVLASDAATVREEGLAAPGAWRAAFRRTRMLRHEVPPALLDGARPALRAAPVMILSAVAGAGWLAVGDAASAWDPLASAGITKALDHGVAAAGAAAACLDGRPGEALDAYQARVFADFTDHVGLRRGLYASERRWAGAPFWRRRRRA